MVMVSGEIKLIKCNSHILPLFSDFRVSPIDQARRGLEEREEKGPDCNNHWILQSSNRPSHLRTITASSLTLLRAVFRGE